MTAIPMGVADRAPVPEFAKTSAAFADNRTDAVAIGMMETLAEGVALRIATDECNDVAEGRFVMGRVPRPVFFYYEDYFCNQQYLATECSQFLRKTKGFYRGFRCSVEYVLQIKEGYNVPAERMYVTFNTHYVLNSKYV
ncbi:MAG TPA: hypothetical protein VMR98_00215, partial [Candidatus Polarisedimenticolaceae bacterium]|nr:hypothetical protein [Candidatus Polarisedimenticolaceae bacterium]